MSILTAFDTPAAPRAGAIEDDLTSLAAEVATGQILSKRKHNMIFFASFANTSI